MFDINGRATSVDEWLEILRGMAPGARLQIAGDALPFPAALSDEPIQRYLGDYDPVPLEEGIRETYDAFKRLLATGARHRMRSLDRGCCFASLSLTGSRRAT